MLDPTATYRSTQIGSSSPAAQVVLLYQGAIRFGTQHLVALERGDIEAAHHASIRCQAIVAGLQEVLDMSAGPIAEQLDQLYDFVLRRLIDGNLSKEPKPTREALQIMRDLLEAWQAIADPAKAARPAPAAALPSSGRSAFLVPSTVMSSGVR